MAFFFEVGEADLKKFLFLIFIFISSNLYSDNIVRHNEKSAFYDEKGKLYKIEEDSNKDGKIDIIKLLKDGAIYQVVQDKDFDNFFETTIFMDKGKVVKVTLDLNKDKSIDKEILYKDGYVESVKIDDNFDGKFDKFQYFDGDKIVKQVEKDKITYFLPDNRKRVVQGDSEFFYFNDTIIKAVVYKNRKIFRTVNFKNGIKDSEEIDVNLDGAVDRKLNYKKGEIFKEIVDSNFDGFFEVAISYEHGNIVKDEKYTKSCKYPIQVKIGETISFDSNCNGIFEKRVTSKGEIKEVAVDKDEDKILDSILEYKGKELLSSKEDTNKDNKFDLFIKYKGGKVIKIEKDSNFDTQIDIVEIYKDGKLLTRKKDLDFDGKFDFEE